MARIELVYVFSFECMKKQPNDRGIMRSIRLFSVLSTKQNMDIIEMGAIWLLLDEALLSVSSFRKAHTNNEYTYSFVRSTTRRTDKAIVEAMPHHW